MKKVGCYKWHWEEMGVSVLALKEAGYDASQMKRMGYEAKEVSL